MGIAREQITGLVLAGGQGSRMGGLDKGLQLLRGKALVAHAVQRLAPQVGPVLISANRHLEQYAALGFAVVQDEGTERAGPLAGMLAGLRACATPYLATVPCDSPGFPADLVAQLAQALTENDAALAMACTAGGAQQSQPVFCLMHQRVCASLAAFVQSGQRKAELWAAQQGCVQVLFPDATAFFNANTLQDLESLQR